MYSELKLEKSNTNCSHKRGYIYFSAEVRNLDSPLDQLKSIWRSIKLSLLNYEIEETILVLQSSTKKRNFDNKFNIVHIHQFSGSEWESRRFMSILKIIKVLIVNLSFKKVTTLRDVYYQDVTLFHRSQRFSNEMVEMVRNSLGVSLEDSLLISASQKGLIYGNCKISLANGISVNLDYNSDPQLIPIISNKIACNIIDIDPVPDVILVMEKDAVFKSFCNYIKKIDYSKTMMVITGKGYPDKLTKRFVHSLSNYLPNVPMLGFMDSDVYGINIFKNYKMKIENESCSDINMILAGVFLLEYKEGWIDVSRRDIKMMTKLIKEIAENWKTDSSRELHKCHRELTRGLYLFKKSEMNIIETKSAAHTYIMNKIDNYTLNSCMEVENDLT